MGIRVWLLLCFQRLQHPARSHLTRFTLLVAVLLAGGVAMDQALGRTYRRLRPSLEENYGRALGRPLKLGPYRGLGWSGLHVGASQILPSGVDRTQLAADGLIVALDPWASLLQRRWVVHLHVRTLQGDWRRNAQGVLWTMPRRQGGGSMPVELWIHTRDPAQFRLWWQPDPDAPPDFTGSFAGQVAFGHSRHGLVIQGKLDLASGGRLSLQSRGVPLSESWSAHGVARAIRLEGLAPLLADTPGEHLSGQVDGAMTVRNNQDSPCRGSLVFKNLQLPLQQIDPTGEMGAVRFDPLPLRCDGPRLQLAPTDFHVDAMKGQVQGSLGLDRHLDLQAGLRGPLPSPLAPLAGAATANLQLLGPLTAPEAKLNLTLTDWGAPSDAGAAPRSFPPLTLQLASHWRSAQEQRQLRASLQAQAGDSRVVMAGQLTPALHLQSSAIRLQPRDWLNPDLWPDQPYTGSLTVAQTGGDTPEVDLRIHNPHLPEDFLLRWGSGRLHVNGSLELAAGRHLGITGQAAAGQWQLETHLAEMDVAPLLAGAPSLPLLPSPLTVTATAQGRYGDNNPSPASGRDSGLQLRQAQLTAHLPHGLDTPDGSLLGPTRLQLQTTAQQQWTVQVDAPRLRSQGVVEWWPGEPWQEAGLDLSLALQDVPLDFFPPLHGELSLTGQLGGSVAQPRLDGELALANGGLALIRFPRRWRGSVLSQADGHALHLAAEQGNASPSAADPTLDVHINSSFQPMDLAVRAGEGHLQVASTEAGYRWRAEHLPLSWLQLVGDGQGDQMHSDGAELAGTLHGKGEFSLRPGHPGEIRGDLTIDGPRWGPLRAHQLDLHLTQNNHQLHLDGQFLTHPTSGQLAWAARINRRPDAPQPWSVHGDLDAVPLRVLRQAVALTRELLQGIRTRVGSGRDLGALAMGAAGETMAVRLERLAMAQERLQELDALLARTTNPQLRNLDGQLHGEVHIRGGAADQPLWAAVRADLHLWLVERGVNHPLAANGAAPLRLRMEGPLQGAGTGTLQFSGLPLKLLSLLANLQLPWQGSLAGRGQHQDLLGERLVRLNLELQGGQFQHQAIQLEPAHLTLEGSTVAVDMALQTVPASPLLTVNGQVNLAGGEEAFQLRFSGGNGVMAFVPSLSDGAVAWTQGNARATLLVRGPLEQPVFHGFLRLQDGEGMVAGMPVAHLNSVVLFNRRNLYVEKLEARVGEAGGDISGRGYLGVFQPLTTDEPLTVTLEGMDINVPNAQLMASGELVLHGSVVEPELGGVLQLGKGVIRADGGNGDNGRNDSNDKGSKGKGAVAADPGTEPGKEAPDNSLNRRLRAWDWREPLELVDLDGPSRMERSLLQALGQLPPLSLRSLQVKLGPELRLEATTVANFTIGGQVRLSGPIGPDLRPVGLVEFLQGRVNLFTSQFRLDPAARNVALFTPSLGIVPYLDVVMWSQEADTSPRQGQGLADVSAAEIMGSTTAFDNLNLVRIQAVVEGPADEFPAILRLQSKPPRSQEELVDLIGGNSVNRLVQGSTNARLFSVVGQPLLAPILNNVSHALGRRVIFAVTPTSFTPPTDGDNQQAPQEFVLAGELGLNLSDRVDVSVLGALNRNDLPPQAKLSVQFGSGMTAEITTDRGDHFKGVLQFSSRF